MFFKLQTVLKISENSFCILQNDKTCPSLKKRPCALTKEKQSIEVPLLAQKKMTVMMLMMVYNPLLKSKLDLLTKVSNKFVGKLLTNNFFKHIS